MIKILCVGKIKEKYLTAAIEEYKKRLSKYTKLEIIEIMDSSLEDETIVKRKEKENLLKHINKKDYIITLEIEGEQLTSKEFANKLESINITNTNITFIIGGSYGLDDDIKKISDLKLSFSKMTFPHQLFRVLLLEQIYRTYKIRNKDRKSTRLNSSHP